MSGEGNPRCPTCGHADSAEALRWVLAALDGPGDGTVTAASVRGSAGARGSPQRKPKGLTMFLGQLDFRAYTLTVISDTEKGARDAMRKAYNKACKGYGDYPPFHQYAEDAGFNVFEMTTDKVEWL